MIMMLGYITLTAIIGVVLLVLWFVILEAHRSLFWAVYERTQSEAFLGHKASLWRLFKNQFGDSYVTMSSPAFGSHPYRAPKWFPLGDYDNANAYDDEEDE